MSGLVQQTGNWSLKRMTGVKMVLDNGVMRCITLTQNHMQTDIYFVIPSTVPTFPLRPVNNTDCMFAILIWIGKLIMESFDRKIFIKGCLMLSITNSFKGSARVWHCIKRQKEEEIHGKPEKEGNDGEYCCRRHIHICINLLQLIEVKLKSCEESRSANIIVLVLVFH